MQPYCNNCRHWHGHGTSRFDWVEQSVELADDDRPTIVGVIHSRKPRIGKHSWADLVPFSGGVCHLTPIKIEASGGYWCSHFEAREIRIIRPSAATKKHKPKKKAVEYEDWIWVKGHRRKGVWKKGFWRRIKST